MNLVEGVAGHLELLEKNRAGLDSVRAIGEGDGVDQSNPGDGLIERLLGGFDTVLDVTGAAAGGEIVLHDVFSLLSSYTTVTQGLHRAVLVGCRCRLTFIIYHPGGSIAWMIPREK